MTAVFRGKMSVRPRLGTSPWIVSDELWDRLEPLLPGGGATTTGGSVLDLPAPGVAMGATGSTDLVVPPLLPDEEVTAEV